MKILIVGAGALGSYFATQLYNSGEDVYLYHHNADKAKLIADQGITIVEPDGKKSNYPVFIYSDIEVVPPVDLVILLVKAYDVRTATQELKNLRNCQPDILFLQNGLGSMEVLKEFFPVDKLFGGVVYQGAYEISIGEIMHTGGAGRICIAPLCEKSSDAAREYANFLANSNLPTEAVEAAGLEKVRWSKLLVNAAINSVATLYGVENGVTAENEQYRQEMYEIAKEGVVVGEAVGVGLDVNQVWDNIINTCQITATNLCSMLCDAKQGKKMELEAILASIVNLGKDNGISTPVLDDVIRRIKEKYNG